MQPLLQVIGFVHSDLKTTQDPPYEGQHKNQEVIPEILPEYCMGLAALSIGNHTQVLYLLHEADRDVLRVYPGSNRNQKMIGVFANRSPMRPNPIGLSTVEIIETGITQLRVRGLDAIDGTPIIDLKSAECNRTVLK